MHLLFARQLLLSSKLPFLQDGNSSLCLHADLFLSLYTPLSLPPYRPLSVLLSFALIFLSLCPQCGADGDLSDSVKLLSTFPGLC